MTAKTGDAKFTSKKVVVSDVDRDGDPDLVAIDAKGDARPEAESSPGRLPERPARRLGRGGYRGRGRERGRHPRHRRRHLARVAAARGEGRWEFLRRHGRAGSEGRRRRARPRCARWCSRISTTMASRTSWRRVFRTSLRAYRNVGRRKVHGLADLLFTFQEIPFFVLFEPVERRGAARRRRRQGRRSRPPRLGRREDQRPRQRRRERERLAGRRPRGAANGLGQGEQARRRQPRRGEGGESVRRAHGGSPAHALRPRRAHEGRRRAGHVDERRAAEPLRPEIEVRREGSPAAQGLVPVRVRAKRRDRRLELRFGRARALARSGFSTTASTSRAPTRASGSSSTATH